MINFKNYSLAVIVCIFHFSISSLANVAIIPSTPKTDYKYIFKMVKPTENEQNAFEDEFIRIVFELNRFAFGFSLRNKTDDPLNVDWNQLAYVDTAGQSHKVMHQGVRYIQRDQALPSTLIPPSAQITDIILPTDYVSYDEGRYGRGWVTQEMFPKPENGQQHRGRTLSIFMPLGVNGKVKNYNFVFSVDIVIEQKGVRSSIDAPSNVSDIPKELGKAPSPELSPIIAITKYLKDMSIAIDEKKSTPQMAVTHYVDPKGERNTLVIGYSSKDHNVGFYIYNFGNLKKARNRDDVEKYLRSLNDAITVGNFFVDDEQDIGYRHIISSDQPPGKAAFELIYHTMTKVALEQRPEIRRLLGVQ